MQVSFKPSQVARVVRRVRHREVPLRVQAVGEHVVEHTSVLRADHAVLRAAQHAARLLFQRDLRNIVRQHSLQELPSPRPARFDLPHVRHVEHAAGFAHRHVLLPHPLVLHRHLEARERHELCARGRVALVQRRSAQAHSRARLAGFTSAARLSFSHEGAVCARGARRAREVRLPERLRPDVRRTDGAPLQGARR